MSDNVPVRVKIVDDRSIPYDDNNPVPVDIVAGGSVGDATAANQVIGNATLTSIDSAIGDQSDSLASSDTATASIIAFIKRESSKSSIAFVEPSITVSISPAYSEGDLIGVGGIITLSNVNIAGGGAVRLESISVNEGGGVAPDLKFIFFKSSPIGGTYTDNATFLWGAGDIDKRVGLVKVIAANWDVVNSKAIVSNSDLNQIMATDGANLYMVIIAGSAYAPSGTGNLTVKLGFSRI